METFRFMWKGHKGLCSHRVWNRCFLGVCDSFLQFVTEQKKTKNIWLYFFTFYRFAFIDLKDHMKGLALSGSYLGRRKLHVMMAKYRDEFGSFSNFGGCQRCCNYKPWLVERERTNYYFERCRYTINLFFIYLFLMNNVFS